MAEEPKNFQELVSWATWQVIEGMTKGEPLRSIMISILNYARKWNPKT